MNPGARNLGRTLALWMGSFVMVAILLFFFGGVPLLPLLAGGAITLVITLIRARKSN